MSPKYLTLLVVATVCNLVAVQLAAQVRTPIRLPADPSAVVILMEDRTANPYAQFKHQEPFLTVRADGSFRTVGQVNPGGEPAAFEGKLTPAELQDLLHFIIEEQQFFGLDSSGSFKPLEPELGMLSMALAHGEFKYGRIQTADHGHESFIDWRRELEPSDQIRQVGKRLQRLVAEKQAGKERVVQTPAIANKFLAREYPEVAPFTADDFIEYGDSRWGALVTFTSLTFRRDMNRGWQRVYVQTSLGQPPQVRYDVGSYQLISKEALEELRRGCRCSSNSSGMDVQSLSQFSMEVAEK